MPTNVTRLAAETAATLGASWLQNGHHGSRTTAQPAYPPRLDLLNVPPLSVVPVKFRSAADAVAGSGEPERQHQHRQYQHHQPGTCWASESSWVEPPGVSFEPRLEAME